MKSHTYSIIYLAVLALTVLTPVSQTMAQQYYRPGVVQPATLQVRNNTQGTSWTRSNITINRSDWVQLQLLPVMSRYPNGSLAMDACWIQNVTAPYFTGGLLPRGRITTGATVNVPNPAPGRSATFIGRCYYTCIGGSQQNCSINQGGPNVNIGWASQRITITTNPPPTTPTSTTPTTPTTSPTSTTPTTPPACSDGNDNDGDGYTDYGTGAANDPGCVSPTDTDETNPTPTTPQCSDSIDNDGDGQIDFPSDLGCASGSDTTEAAPPTITANGRSSGVIVRSGASVQVDWQTNGGTNCSLSGNVPDNDTNPNNSGGRAVTVRNQSTFTITCNGQSDSVTVQVLPIIYE